MQFCQKIFPLIQVALFAACLACSVSCSAQLDSTGSLLRTDSLLKMLSQTRISVFLKGSENMTAHLKDMPGVLLQQMLTDLPTVPFAGRFGSVVNNRLLKTAEPRIEIESSSVGNNVESYSGLTNRFAVHENIIVAGIPLNANWVNFYGSSVKTPANDLPTIEFDRKVYLHSLREKIKDKLNATRWVEYWKRRMEEFKSTLVNELTHDVDSIYRLYSHLFPNKAQLLGAAADWLQVDMKSLENQLISLELVASSEQAVSRLAFLRRMADSGNTCPTRIVDSLKQMAGSVAAMRAMLDRVGQIQQVVKVWSEQPSLVNTDSLAQRIVENPLTMRQFLRNGAKGGFLLRLFANVNHFCFGNKGVEMSPLTLHQFSGQGLNFSVSSGKLLLDLNTSIQNDFDRYMTDESTMPGNYHQNNMLAIGVGKGKTGASLTRVTFLSFRPVQLKWPIHFASVDSRTTVFTISRQQQIGEATRFTADISHSSTAMAHSKAIAGHTILNAQFPEQMAFICQLNGSLCEKTLSYSVRLFRNGRAYNNPGNVLAMQGNTGGAFNVQKRAYKNKLTISLSALCNAMSTATRAEALQNYSGSLKIRWKLGPGRQIAFSYQPSYSWRVSRGLHLSLGNINRLSFESSERLHTGKTRLDLLTRLSIERYGFSMYSGLPGVSRILLSSLLNIVRNNKSSWVDFLFGTGSDPLNAPAKQLSINAGINYHIGRVLQCSSSAGYCQYGEAIGQLVVSAALQTRLGNQLAVAINGSLASGAARQTNFYSVGNRIDCSFSYNIKP